MLRDTQPDQPEDLYAVQAPAATVDEDDADPPEPFEWQPPASS